jgi:seryl-tRNA synthetase
MLDVRFVRAQPDAVRRAAAMKRIDFDVDALLSADAERRRLLQTTEELKAEQNRTSKAIAGLQGEARATRIAEMQALVARLRELDAEAKRADEEFERLMLLAPNVPADDVPEGADESDNTTSRSAAGARRERSSSSRAIMSSSGSISTSSTSSAPPSWPERARTS